MSPLHTLQQRIARKKHAIHSLSFLSLGSVVASVSGLFSVIILANFLSQNDYGNYKYVFSVVGLLSALSLTGSYRTIIIQSVSKGFDGIVEYLRQANLRLNAPMLLGACVVGFYYHHADNNFLALAVPIVALATTFVSNSVIASSYLNGRKAFKKLFYYQLIASTINVLVLITLVTLTSNLIFIILGSSTTLVLTAFIYLHIIRRSYLRNDLLDQKILSYGKHLNFLNMTSVIIQNIDSILIFHYLGSQNLALYAMATPFIDRILGFFKTSYFFALPKFTEMGPERARAFLYKRSSVAFLVGLGIVCVYYFIAPIFFETLFPKYVESIPLSILFSLNIPIVAFMILPSAYIDSLIEIRNKYILHAVTFTVRITSLVFCILTFGIPGVIWSELFTRLVTLCMIVFLIERSVVKDPSQ